MGEVLKQYLMLIFNIKNLRKDGPISYKYDGQITDEQVAQVIAKGQLRWLDENHHDLEFGDGSEVFYIPSKVPRDGGNQYVTLIRADGTFYYG